MSALELVAAGGRGLDRRLDSVPAPALLGGLRAAGAVSEPEAAALGRPGECGWARRLRALAVAKGDRTCQILLRVLEGLEGPPRPGPFDFYDPGRDSAPSHRSDCPCCRPREEEEGQPKNEAEGHEEEEGEPENEDEGPEDEEGGGDEGPEGDEGHEDEEGEPENEDEGPEDEEGGGGDEGPEGDEGPDDDDDDGGGDEGPEDDDGDDGGGDED